MSDKMSRHNRILVVVLAAITMGGGIVVATTRNAPDAAAAPGAQPAPAEATAPHAHTVTLYKSPTCTCCGKWGEHLREAGFVVREVVSDDVPAMMEEHGVPMHLRSCHLGVVGDYTLVGHVPADLAARLLEEKPAVTGIAVPGMPLGSPGMEGMGRSDAYEVIAFGPKGAEHVFANR